jgi:hypothetical protein
LNAEGKASRRADASRLDGAVAGSGFDDQIVADAVDPLAMQRVHPRVTATGQTLEQSTRRDEDVMRRRVALAHRFARGPRW